MVTDSAVLDALRQIAPQMKFTVCVEQSDYGVPYIFIVYNADMADEHGASEHDMRTVVRAAFLESVHINFERLYYSPIAVRHV